MHLFVSLNKRDVDNKKAIQCKIVISSSYRWLWSQFGKKENTGAFYWLMNSPNTVFGEAKKFTTGDLFHLGATVLHTHITLCLSGVQCQQFEWSTMSTLVSWSSTQRPVNNRSQPMCHLPPSTLLPPSPLLQKSSQKHSSFEWLHELLNFQFYQICSCPRANTWMTPSYQARVLGEKWHFKLRVRRWQSRCKSYEWYQHHILCSIQTFFLVCWDYIIANYQKLQKLRMHLEGVLLLNITHSSSSHFGWQ